MDQEDISADPCCLRSIGGGGANVRVLFPIQTRHHTLSHVAYFCVTMLENLASGNRTKAARLMNISTEVVRKLATLSSERGGVEARKAKGTAHPYSAQEVAWMEAAIRAIIRRCGEKAADPDCEFPRLTMTDFSAWTFSGS